MAGFVLSNLTGLVRQILVSNAFGTQSEIDAFNAAARVPDTLFVLVAGGALASAFIPTFTALLDQEARDQAWKLASSVLNLVSLVLAAVSLLAFALAPAIVRYGLAPQFDAPKQALAAELLRILLISPVVFGASGLLMGVLNAHQHFLLPALAPTLHWLGWIAGVLLFVPAMGVHGLAWGAVLGAGLHLAVQIPGLRRLPGARYTLTLGLQHAVVRQVARLMGPRVFGTAVVQLNFWINVVLASGMPTGSLTAIGVAFAVMTMPQVVIAQAIAIAALPTFSAQIARGAPADMRASLAAVLRGVVLLSLPAAVGLILLRVPVTRLLFERGEFDARSTQLVAWALLWYTLGLVSHSVVEITSRAFYALQDTKTPVLVGAAAMGANVILSFALAGWFADIGWMPHGGLALANTAATTLEMAALLVLLRRRLGGLVGRRILAGCAQAAAGSGLMAAGIVGWLGVSSSLAMEVLGVLVGALLYALALFLLRVEEVLALSAWLRSRLRRD